MCRVATEFTEETITELVNVRVTWMDSYCFTECFYVFKIFLQLVKSLVITLFEEYKQIREDFELQINHQYLLDRFVLYAFISFEIFMQKDACFWFREFVCLRKTAV